MDLRHDDAFAGAAANKYSPDGLAPQVLVVDDAEEIREAMAWLLRAGGYRVLAAEDGLAAQTVLRKEHPALVITDLEMPNGDGWQLLAHCHECYPGLPVLIVSGASLGRRPEIECWAAGCLPKPWRRATLDAEVRRLLSRGRLAAAGFQYPNGRSAHRADRPAIYPAHALLDPVPAGCR